VLDRLARLVRDSGGRPGFFLVPDLDYPLRKAMARGAAAEGGFDMIPLRSRRVVDKSHQ
jgi:hypothetical protein